MLKKEEVLAACKNLLVEKRSDLSRAMAELRESLESETKSSVGDKHETARARMQAEQEKLGAQSEELKKQEGALNKVDPSKQAALVGNHCLVTTNHGIFFIVTALGKLEVNGQIIYVISPDSPLARALQGLKITGQVKVNSMDYQVREIC